MGGNRYSVTTQNKLVHHSGYQNSFSHSWNLVAKLNSNYFLRIFYIDIFGGDFVFTNAAQLMRKLGTFVTWLYCTSRATCSGQKLGNYDSFMLQDFRLAKVLVQFFCCPTSVGILRHSTTFRAVLCRQRITNRKTALVTGLPVSELLG